MATTYEPIATTTISGSTTTTFSFTSIPSTYTDLRVIIVGEPSTYSYSLNLQMKYNSSSTGYSVTNVYGSGSAPGSSSTTNATYIRANIDNYGIGFWDINIFSYTASMYKTALTSFNNNANTNYGITEKNVSLWQNTSAITSITFNIANPSLVKFGDGMTFTLYGILRA